MRRERRADLTSFSFSFSFSSSAATGAQLGLARKHHLPLFLHSRAAHRDLVQILREEGFGEDGGRVVGGKGGVVHSFTGSIEECKEYVRHTLFC